MYYNIIYINIVYMIEYNIIVVSMLINYTIDYHI